MKLLNLLSSVLIMIASVFLCHQIVSNSLQNQINKNNYAELNNVKYGLFSIDIWKDKLLTIVAQEFDKLYLSNQTENELREHVAIIMNKMIDEATAKIEKANKATTVGKMKQMFINMFVDVNDIKKGIPEYTDAVIVEMKDPKTKKQIKSIVNKQLSEYATKTADLQDRTELRRILQLTASKDVKTARKKISESISTTHALIVKEAIALIILSILLFVLFVMSHSRYAAIQFPILIVSLTLLLVSGIATPMIDMEAKISQLKFALIGHPILFENQVLYFQSKSIMDVFWVMILNPDFQMKAVGILVISFSVFFPLIKLISSLIFYFNLWRARSNRVINFFVFKSGKWSMADVMVVAIFMAYIGFSGIISSQLENLSAHGAGMDVITTNGTSLQPGYYLFLTYVVLAVSLSGMLNKKISAIDAK